MDNTTTTITHHKKASTEANGFGGGHSFSFPSTPNPDSDFEFGFGVDSPLVGESLTSPADHLFLNGRLLPHSFPLPATSRSTSTRDSLLSSRSNSTNSSCSSARTSSSDSSERKLFHKKVKGGSGNGTLRSTSNSSHYQAYGCSQRWQYITPVPGLNRNDSMRRRDTKLVKKKMEKATKRNNSSHNNNNKKKKKSKTKKEHKGMKLRFGRRILRWFVMACRECHAMEPSSSKDRATEI